MTQGMWEVAERDSICIERSELALINPCLRGDRRASRFRALRPLVCAAVGLRRPSCEIPTQSSQTFIWIGDRMTMGMKLHERLSLRNSFPIVEKSCRLWDYVPTKAMTTILYFAAFLLGGGCGVVVIGAFYVPVRKHRVWCFGIVVGVATGLSVARYVFLGAEWLLLFMGVSAMLGAGIGSLGGKFLESKLRTGQ
jgi:hypothetical protein